jgi:TRAP-type uncharacterized transport system substrate-binding protein
LKEEKHERRMAMFKRRLTQITRVSWRDLASSLGPVLALSALAILAALHFVRPAPPDTLTISSGPEGSSFRSIAERYQKILAGSGVRLTILPSNGSLENLNRLSDPHQNVDIAFVQSGVTVPADTGELVSLGSVGYQPLTVFYRGRKPIQRLSQLAGKRIAIGPEGSGTRFLALALLKANEIEPQGLTQLLALEGEAARNALLGGQADAIFLSGDSAAPATVREMLHAKGIRLFEFPQADGYLRRFPYLSRLEIPPGAFDLGADLPHKPLTMLAPTVELVARADLHPALSDLLIDAAREVHGKAALLQSAGEFPTPAKHEFPISDDAARYYKSGKSIAYRLLPFWLASLVNRAFVVLVPVIVVLIPGLRLAPALYRWRIHSRIYRRYGELMALERAALEDVSPEQRAALLDRLADIERSVIASKIPGAYADQLYILRQHIKFVRDRLVPAAADAAKPADVLPPSLEG